MASGRRKAYDRGNGAAILLYNKAKGTVVLTRQFRLPVYINGHDGLLIEAAAGLLDDASPEARIIAEAEEETGFHVTAVEKVFEAYMAPVQSRKNSTFSSLNMQMKIAAARAAGWRTKGKIFRCWSGRSKKPSPPFAAARSRMPKPLC